jgi:hypothetical protein
MERWKMENRKTPEEGEWKMVKTQKRRHEKWEKTGRGVMENGKKPEEGEWKMEKNQKRGNGKWKTREE